jgi:hypothetical protein
MIFESHVSFFQRLSSSVRDPEDILRFAKVGPPSLQVFLVWQRVDVYLHVLTGRVDCRSSGHGYLVQMHTNGFVLSIIDLAPRAVVILIAAA